MTKILIIEDEEGTREGLCDVLRLKGYEVSAASSGFEGLKTAKAFLPSLIICDVMMPDIDGFKLKELVNLDGDLSTTPFIFLTAKSEMEYIRRGMNLGAADYLTKPYKVSEILTIIETRLSIHEKIIQKELVKNRVSKPEEGERKYSDEDILFVNLTNSSPRIIKINEIKCIEAAGSYSKIYLENSPELLYRKSITSWEKSLDGKNFLRIHRSIIINLKVISKIQKWSSYTYLIYLKGIDKPFTVSQRYAAKIRSHLKL